jgi:hypothetical protein
MGMGKTDLGHHTRRLYPWIDSIDSNQEHRDV